MREGDRVPAEGGRWWRPGTGREDTGTAAGVEAGGSVVLPRCWVRGTRYRQAVAL